MSTSISRSLAVSSILVLLLSGCNSKKYQAKIKELEENIETIESEAEANLEEKDEEIYAKEKEHEEAQEKSMEEVDKLKEENNALKFQVSDIQHKLDRVQAALDAKTPKDATVPGHQDFDPSQQERFVNAMASITGDKSNGTGFIVEDAGKHYLYTAAATLGGNSRLAVANAAGTKLTKFGNLEVAEKCEFVRLELLESDGLPALQIGSAGTEPNSSSKLSCLGISAANGSVSGDNLTPFGQSNEAIDLDPNQLVGKIGGPLIDISTGKVLAIVTTPANERADLWGASADSGEVRLTAARINRTLSWQAIPVATFLAESKAIADFDRFTKVVQAFAAMTPGPEGLGLETPLGNAESVKSVLTEESALPVVAEAIALHTQLATNKSRMGEADLKKRITSIFATVGGQSKRNVASFDPAKFSAYHRNAAEQSLKWRNEADQRLEATTEGIADLQLKPVVEKPSPRDEKR